MSLPQTEVIYSVEEYLALERASEERHEYLDGVVYEMAGESPAHGAICVNLVGQLYNQLRGGPCQLFTKDMKVRSGPAPRHRRSRKGLFSYPDLVVVCGEMQFHDEHQDVLLNPSVIIEVTSPTTEHFDHTGKWLRYQTWLPTLTDYVLVAQLRPVIEHFRRQPEGKWLYTPVNGLEGSLRIDSINCTLPLAEVFDRVVFPPEDDLIADDEELRPRDS